MTKTPVPAGMSRASLAATDPIWTRALVSRRRIDHSECVNIFQRKLYLLELGLTERERRVCALAMTGVSIEGSAYELGIKKSSVITYRKRAYARLGISSLNELFLILTFSTPANDGLGLGTARLMVTTAQPDRRGRPLTLTA